jgi:hypothetical protein
VVWFFFFCGVGVFRGQILHFFANQGSTRAVYGRVERYRTKNNQESVVAYEEGAYGIVLHFLDGSTYLYTAASAGPECIAEMKALAREGRGLSSYVVEHAANVFAKRLS